MCILCIYYGWLPGTERQNQRSSGLLLGPRSSFHVPSPSPPLWLINWHRDARPADHGGPAAFNETSILEYDQRPGNPAKPSTGEK